MFEDGSVPRVRIQAKGKLNAEALDIRTSGRLRWDVTAQVVKATVYMKKRIDISPNTALNLKGEAHLKADAPGILDGKLDLKHDLQSRIEFSHKLLNITDTQDARIRIGWDLVDKCAYVEGRENHLTLRADSKGAWNVLYDL